MIRHAPPVARCIVITLGLLLVACQPVDDEVDLDQQSPAPEEEDGAAGADFDRILSAADEAADEWDAAARLVEISVSVEDGAPVSGRVTFLGPDAARLLVVEVTGDTVEEQQPTAETLGFEPVPADALSEVPEPPEDLVEPDGLVDDLGGVLVGCGVDEAREILYATGAPAGWDGSAWVDAPQWRVTVVGEDGAGAVLEPDGEPRSEPCIDVR